jgi:hypothetical protein
MNYENLLTYIKIKELKKWLDVLGRKNNIEQT